MKVLEKTRCCGRAGCHFFSSALASPRLAPSPGRLARRGGRGPGLWSSPGKSGARGSGFLSGRPPSPVLFCRPRGFSGSVGATAEVRAATGRGDTAVLLGIPRGAWQGAQAAMEYDFKEEKPDSEAVAMLRCGWRLEGGDRDRGHPRAGQA